LKAFPVPYHPAARAGPHDAAYLFDRFCDLMAGSVHEPSDGAQEPPAETSNNGKGA